jgi:hypothetical protein
MDAPGEFFFYSKGRKTYLLNGMISMNHLVFLDAKSGELEKILSGVKRMILKEFDPLQSVEHPVQPGDSLFFLRDNNECELRVQATVTRVLVLADNMDESLPRSLKEMQPRLHLTEEQFNVWSTKKQALLIEFNSAQKIPVIIIAQEKIRDRSSWMAFDEFSLIA